ncbi:MAG TPA: DUF4292 domain-containing protein, partial [Chitinophagaceae bacterium]
CIGLLASCRSSKKITTAIAKKDTIQSVAFDSTAKRDSILFIQNSLNGLANNRIQYQTFSAKINIDYSDADNKNYDVNAVLRMYKDSAIWISVNAILGIEAIRALITQDSVKILDKQNKLITARSVDYLQEVTELPLDLQTVQDLIIGNPVYLDTNNVVSYSKGNNSIGLLSLGYWFKNLLTINESDKTLQRIKLDDADISRSRTADLTYTDYETKKGPLFATKRRIIFAEKKKLDIRLDFKQYEFNTEVSFPFSIPKNYRYN